MDQKKRKKDMSQDMERRKSPKHRGSLCGYGGGRWQMFCETAYRSREPGKQDFFLTPRKLSTTEES
jgi:hypothetical protein